MFMLYGPMASWGSPAPGTHRDSLDHPTRSAILGLLAGALGHRHDQDGPHRAMEQRYGIAVRVDAPGVLLRDYHTVQTVKREGKYQHPSRRSELTRDPERVETMLTRRDYRADGVWTIALWPTGKEPHTLIELKAALERPRFVPYLGRKSCPLGLPTQAEIIDVETLREAFAAYRPNHPVLLGGGVRFLDRPPIYWSGHPNPAFTSENDRSVRDAILSRSLRTFGARTEYETRTGVPKLEGSEQEVVTST